MIESGKINSRQAIWLLITLVVTTAGIYVPPLIVSIAGRDAWLSVIAATLAALLIAWLIVGLVQRFPGKNLFAIMELSLGIIPGKIIAFLYVLYFIHLEILVLSEFGHFHSFSLPGTPIVVNYILAFIAITYIARNGLEVISRLNELFLPLFIFLVGALSALSLLEMDATKLLPVFDYGTAAIMKGSFTTFVWLGEIICLAAIIPSLNKPDQTLRVAFLSVMISGLIIVIDVVYPLLIFGPELTASFRYPLFNGIRIINIANFLERLEALPTVLWIAGGFIKMSILRYIAVLGAAQCLGLKDYRPLVLPVGAVVVAGSLLMYWDVLGTTRFLAEVMPFYGLTFEAVIPLLLFVLVIARGLGGKDKSN